MKQQYDIDMACILFNSRGRTRRSSSGLTHFALLRVFSVGNGRVFVSNLRPERLARAKRRKIRERRGETDDESQ